MNTYQLYLLYGVQCSVVGYKSSIVHDETMEQYVNPWTLQEWMGVDDQKDVRFYMVFMSGISIKEEVCPFFLNPLPMQYIILLGILARLKQILHNGEQALIESWHAFWSVLVQCAFH